MWQVVQSTDVKENLKVLVSVSHKWLSPLEVSGNAECFRKHDETQQKSNPFQVFLWFWVLFI